VPRLVHGLRVARVNWLHPNRNYHSGFHVHGVLRLVGQMRAPVLHLRDPRIGIVRVHRFLVGALLGPFPIQPRQLCACGRFDTGLLGQPPQQLLGGGGGAGVLAVG